MVGAFEWEYFALIREKETQLTNIERYASYIDNEQKELAELESKIKN